MKRHGTYGVCPACSDSREIPRETAPDTLITCGWCRTPSSAILWVTRGRAERERMGFDAPPPLDAE